MAMIERPSLKGFGSDEAVASTGGCLEACFLAWYWSVFVLGFVFFCCLLKLLNDLSKILRPKTNSWKLFGAKKARSFLKASRL